MKKKSRPILVICLFVFNEPIHCCCLFFTCCHLSVDKEGFFLLLIFNLLSLIYLIFTVCALTTLLMSFITFSYQLK